MCNIIKRKAFWMTKMKEDVMRGGKRPGAGRRPRFGAYRETTTMRVPAPLKQDIIAYIEHLCGGGDQGGPKIVTKSKQGTSQGKTDNVAFSKDGHTEAITILNQALQLRANAGGAMKGEIRRALKILAF